MNYQIFSTILIGSIMVISCKQSGSENMTKAVVVTPMEGTTFDDEALKQIRILESKNGKIVESICKYNEGLEPDVFAEVKNKVARTDINFKSCEPFGLEVDLANLKPLMLFRFIDVVRIQEAHLKFDKIAKYVNRPKMRRCNYYSNPIAYMNNQICMIYGYIKDVIETTVEETLENDMVSKRKSYIAASVELCNKFESLMSLVLRDLGDEYASDLRSVSQELQSQVFRENGGTAPEMETDFFSYLYQNVQMLQFYKGRKHKDGNSYAAPRTSKGALIPLETLVGVINEYQGSCPNALAEMDKIVERLDLLK